MHGTAPLLRSVASITSHSPSRIPHLRFHIALRQKRPQQVPKNGPKFTNHQQQKRRQSTLAQNGYFDRTLDGAESKEVVSSYQATTSKERNRDVADEIPSRYFDVQQATDTNMFNILEEGIPDRILSGLMSESIGTPFIQLAPDQLFNKALLMLDPGYFVEPFKDLHRHLKGPRISAVSLSKSIDGRLATFAAYLDRLVALRRESGKSLNLEACNHVLKCAASMGDQHMARSILEDIMPADGVEPDLESFNYYAEALIWSHAFSSVENYNLRVTPKHLEIRGSGRPPKSLSGHKTSNPVRGIEGIRETVLNTFKACTAKGYTPNGLTFINTMTAMGREGDLDGVKSILKSVWNINVDLLGTYDEEELESPTFYDIDHPLRPAENLLFTIAHIFGGNNDIRTAWLLVDYVSRNYNLPITERVWAHLCEWAFVLLLRRSKAERKQGKDIGHVTYDSLVQMVKVMTDEPHNIKPNAVVHFLLSRTWRDQRHLDNTLFHVEQLVRIADQKQATIKQRSKQVLQFAEKAVREGQTDVFATVEFYNLRRQYMIEYAEFQQSLQLANVAVHRNLLAEKNWPGAGRLTEWERRKLPALIAKFAAYLPSEVTYRTKTGNVELHTKHKRRAQMYNERKLDLRTLPRIHNAMDMDDHARLVSRMRALSDVIITADRYCFRCDSTGHEHSHCPLMVSDSSSLDYKGEVNHDTNGPEADEIMVLDPSIHREDVPPAFEPGTEKEYSKPRLPFV